MNVEKFEILENALANAVEYWSDRVAGPEDAKTLLSTVQALVTLEESRRQVLSAQ